MRAVARGTATLVDEERHDGQPNERTAEGAAVQDCGFTWPLRRPGDAIRHDGDRWHTCKNTARINAAIPAASTCSWTTRRATWLSLNLMKYKAGNGQFDVEAFRQAVDVTITAQEILVDIRQLPDKKD